MTIDIRTPHDGLEESILQHAKQAMIRLAQQYKAIGKLECVMRKDPVIAPPENKVCEIRLSAYGENLFTHSRADRYESAVNEALEHLKSQLAVLASRQNELPDNVTSTVKV